MRYYLGLDNGGTTKKAALCDTAGNEMGTASESTHMLVPRPGFAEQDMDVMWRTNCCVIREVLQRTGVRKEVGEVAVCGRGKGLYLCGARGEPLCKGILSADNRASAYPLRWRQEGVKDAIYPIIRQKLLPHRRPGGRHGSGRGGREIR